MSGDTKRVLEVNQIDNLQGSTQRVKQETTLNNLRGITQRVYVVGGGGGNIDELNVTPSTSAQTITAPEGTDGYSPVNVAAVTSAIDANITAGNIKKDVEILGVTGSYEGQTPTGTMYIISNGTYNVADKAIANVQVPTTVPELYRVFGSSSGKLSNSISTAFIPLSNTITDVADYILYKCYYSTPSSVLYGSVDLSNLTTLSGNSCCQYMFYNCPGITSVDLSNLTTVSGTNAMSSAFQKCTGITSVDLSNLTTVSGIGAMSSAFNGCYNITSVNVSNLTTLSAQNAMGSMFYGCFNLTSITYSALSTVTGNGCLSQCFAAATGLTSISFPALKSTSFGTQVNQFNNLISGVTGCTIHFPSNLDPQGGSTVISSLASYPNFGGTNTVLAFDLPATE